MKKLLKILMLGVLAVFVTASIAGANNFYFDDNDNYWPTWFNNSPAPSGKSADDDRDQIGGPNIKYLEVWTDASNNLTYIDIGIGEFNGHYIDHYDPTALFIDNTGDFKWDYYVEGKNAENTTAPLPEAKLYNVHGLNISLFNPTPGDWPTSTEYENSTWGSGNPDYYREDHPAGIANPGAYIGSPGYEYNSSFEILSYDFTGLTGIDINLSDNPNDWLIGFTEVCANDVILGGNPVPEPATLLLLGSGLLGLAGIGRKKFKKS